ncbi:MAG: HAD-IIB family hydrolase [Candidatus Hydrogenedentota bacterium]
MYIQMISIHGLIRGEQIEMGRDADTGGQVRYVVELAKTLGTFDIVSQVDLFTRQIKDKRVSDDYAQPVEELGPKARIVRLPCGGGKYMRKERLWPYLDDYVDAMIWFTRKEGLEPTLVHGHYADAGYLAKEVASSFAVPFIFTGHSLGRDKRRYLEEQGWSHDAMNKEFRIDHRIHIEESVMAEADLVIASTSHEKKTQYGRYDNGTEPAFAVIPPGTSLERFFPYYEYELNSENIDERFRQARIRMSKELDRFHFKPDKPTILSLCRPDKRKNIGALIEAYGKDKELQAVANLAVFAGIRKTIEDMPEGEQEVLTDILLQMDRYDLYGRLAIPKRHDSEVEVPELYRLAASKGGIFVNSAFVEPFGLTFIESSAVGLPFVGTHNGGPQDIIANCDSGLLVDVSDPDALGNAMKQLLTDRDLWEKCSTNGVNRVREHYAWEAHCSTYIERIQELTKISAKNVVNISAEKAAPGRRLAELDFLLISDIDNTLLGNDEGLDELRKVIEDNRDRMGFGVASGRHVDAVREVLEANKVPPLDVCICSVGAEIYYGTDYLFDKGWASHLRPKWRPERIHEALDALPWLSLQPDEKTQREFKISYDLDTSQISADEALPLVYEALSRARVPHNIIFSHGAFIDILPARASKGKAIRYIATKWNIPLEKVASAGDSGNDRDMLQGSRTSGIIVGNYAEELEPLRKSSARVYFAEGHCAAGITEGLRHYGFI